ncbi:MAG: SOS response-associated peptidase [Planctomycetaceae bacterium]|nr:SOS response-associated peptidase [Planctomycetaceae bacterium]
MCGRFTLRTSASEIAKQFGVLDVAPSAPRFNIAPTQAVPVVRVAPEVALAPHPPESGEPRRELVGLRWGLVPSWAKDPQVGSRLINARAETAASKPAFRAAMRRRRCLMLADGFYEWRREGQAKQPYFIRLRDDRPFAFAALWEAWEGPDHSLLETCALLTTEANELLRPIHDRMPAILPPESYRPWLNHALDDPRPLVSLLAPYPSSEMDAYPVARTVNDPANESPRCVDPKERMLF